MYLHDCLKKDDSLWKGQKIHILQEIRFDFASTSLIKRLLSDFILIGENFMNAVILVSRNNISTLLYVKMRCLATHILIQLRKNRNWKLKFMGGFTRNDPFHEFLLLYGRTVCANINVEFCKNHILDNFLAFISFLYTPCNSFEKHVLFSGLHCWWYSGGCSV